MAHMRSNKNESDAGHREGWGCNAPRTLMSTVVLAGLKKPFSMWDRSSFQ